ncbi:MAG: cell division protein [Candidatus Dactylopiibacterium carminicum]|uniref:Cell division protein FtsQ n=1 Tax=Candidatus Dactylopiibacterium carminicum TaxID=857335 RepID=A0A272EQS0_9RHOO|nr:cell division protein [Candidatus Dactylopiibacterium carminicum]PAS92455.1 MAG: cell division protein [Candidatus Dactylopiibacterium carminicum]PAS99301.1 MAG: cell division protein [Candidatus Dactylopiibacterium carminicum]
MHTAAAGHGAEPRPAGARTRVRSGFWHRPDWINLVADTLILLASIVLGYALVIAVVRLPLFGLREVVVLDAPQRVTAEQIEYAAETALRGNFFTVDLERAREAFETLPWVRQAQLRRRWPAAVEVSLEEHAAVAQWQSPETGESSLVNTQGELFDAAAGDSLPVFAGPSGTTVLMLAEMQHLNRILGPLGRHVAQLKLSGRLAWQVVLDDGLVIELGKNQPKSPVEARLERFVAAWPDIRMRFGERLKVADLRYPSGFAARVGAEDLKRGTQ